MNILLKNLKLYFWNFFITHKFLSIIGIYFIMSVILESAFEIDICIPCIWKKIFGFNCWGCGLTTALVKLTQLDFVGAYHSNPLIFIVLPAGTYYWIQDYLKFKNNKYPAKTV
jgi:hypothetical protein